MQKSSLLKNQFSGKLIHSYLPAESDKHKGGAGSGNLRGIWLCRWLLGTPYLDLYPRLLLGGKVGT